MAFRNILVTGANGMLGRDLVPYLRAKGYPVTGLARDQLDVLDSQERLELVLEAHEPDLVIHCGAYTNVDGAERDPDMAMAVNKEGTRKLAQACKRHDAILMYISTDYVFDGTKGEPYHPSDRPNPLGVYGRSKYYGELMVSYYIVRTSWLYGLHNRNFVQFVLEAARQGREMTIITDQVGSPTWTGSLCVLIEQVMQSGRYGIYHGADRGALSRFEQAQRICQAAGLSTEGIIPVTSDAFGAMAPRPRYSVLDTDPLAATPWDTALQAYLELYFHAAATR
jgi:dTDP-4-dehydrorhamnose reductase